MNKLFWNILKSSFYMLFSQNYSWWSIFLSRVPSAPMCGRAARGGWGTVLHNALPTLTDSAAAFSWGARRRAITEHGSSGVGSCQFFASHLACSRMPGLLPSACRCGCVGPLSARGRSSFHAVLGCLVKGNSSCLSQATSVFLLCVC